MELPRRKFLRLAVGAAALSSSARRARALDYPVKPVRVIVPFAAGGSTDIAGRLICQWLSERTGQQFIVENRTDAGTNLGTELVVRATPDGYTLLVVGATNTINVTLYEKLNFDFVRDITPVAGIVRSPLVMEVNASLPVNTVPEFIAYAKANPGKVNMASSGVGATPHMAGELFQWMAGIKMVHVPYRGDAPALAEAIDQIKAGKIRALAVSTAVRLDVVPDVPAMNEYLPGYEASSWYGMGAPRATPPDIIGRLNKEINAGLDDRKLVARFAELGLTVLPGSSSEFRKFIGDETEKWSKVVRASGARAD
jgi:tripartite-type tricarboxylate transporter receptor subunit TctC